MSLSLTLLFFSFFFFNDTATTEIYTLSLHDALPIRPFRNYRPQEEDAVSLAQRFERRLEGLVGGAFARLFKGQVEPVEIGSALQREAADKRKVMGGSRVLSP